MAKDQVEKGATLPGIGQNDAKWANHLPSIIGVKGLIVHPRLLHTYAHAHTFALLTTFTLNNSGGYMVGILVLWQMPYLKHLLYPFKVKPRNSLSCTRKQATWSC